MVFKKYVRSCALGESSLIIGVVKSKKKCNSLGSVGKSKVCLPRYKEEAEYRCRYLQNCEDEEAQKNIICHITGYKIQTPIK